MLHEEQVTFRGKRSDVDELLRVLSSIEEVADVQVKSVTSTINSLLDREPLNQVELVDIVLGIAINLASSAIYDQIRHKINDHAKKKGFLQRSGQTNRRKG
ncbi:hypothetical protein DP113_01405 [Brasilonema octagenarum UFV-E1]|uniref:Uncharacterized protein n=2 Tax=Brasilonema TaxID=383614 RepID=A0A856M6G2_9CYAN|nr:MULTISPECIES: hypothetical protein [Brasilonema]NMF66113.1 hypothetical protein [Brasilonema octagenarum UFV-OR1]QDL06745.1 hypothetical protein DP114_01415 [Brasilonema sennae CENA114]QDL13114.1 hypothetical protein DP113_01405 [Brasilonema octagenarum UFV-E1]